MADLINITSLQNDIYNSGTNSYTVSMGASNIDDTTNAIKVIHYSHHEIHSGSHYTYRRFYDVLKAGTKEFLIITPDTTTWAHMIIGVGTNTSSVIVELFQAPTVTATGLTELTINRNLNITKVNTTIIAEDPTVSSPGLLLIDGKYGAGKNSDGGGIRDEEEMVLEQNQVYLMRVTEINVAATTINVHFDWYEHENK